MNGGYILVDCNNLDLTKGETPQTIAGIYDVTKKAMATGKPIVACNCIWGSGKPVTPISIMAIDFGDVIICMAATLQIIITPASVVTINNLVAD